MSKINPYQIGIAKNDRMGCYDIQLNVGGIKTEKEAKRFADLLNDWMQKDSGKDAWSAKVQ